MGNKKGVRSDALLFCAAKYLLFAAIDGQHLPADPTGII